MPTTLSIAKAIQSIKGGSSAWIHQNFGQLRNFSWQEDYGAFSGSIFPASGDDCLYPKSGGTSSHSDLSGGIFGYSETTRIGF
jgi:hypothetical protein